APAAIDYNLQAEQLRDRVVDLLGVMPADRDIAEQAAEAPVSAILFRATRALASSAKIASKHRREWHHCGFWPLGCAMLLRGQPTGAKRPYVAAFTYFLFSVMYTMLMSAMAA
ncbi:MAG: hypothetical protein WB710_08765, partial [Stellaceae bacterium]